MNDRTLPRQIAGTVERAAEVMPVVVVTGARQTGKSTLVRELLQDERPYYSLDNLDVRSQAERSPRDLVSRADSLVLDEVQRVPDLMLTVKEAVDSERRPGRFILTGSANLLLMKRVSETLAGRATYLTLGPMTRRELMGMGRSGSWSHLFEHPWDEWGESLESSDANAADWRVSARIGGYPVVALELSSDEDRGIWFDGYVRTYLERDLQDISAIDNLVDFRRLMGATCLRLGQLLNQTELGRDVQLPQPTVRRWLNLLETSHQLVRLPAYASNRGKRLIKTPKAYWSDTALALHLGGWTEPTGAHLENLILCDLLSWRDASLPDRPGVFYWRTTGQEEVDFVIEQGTDLIAVEVKATTRPRPTDARHLASFRDQYGDSVRGCLLLHCGDGVERLGERLVAAPWWRVI